MASNEQHLIKRVIERDSGGKPVFNFGIFSATSHGGRQLTTVIEGSYQDARKFLKADKLFGKGARKGFKRVSA